MSKIMIFDSDHDLGYGDTLGWSGSDTSRERAEDEAESGLASARLSHALDLLQRAGPYGLTWNELSGLTSWHHGQASGTLSVLHKTHKIMRLHDRRGRSKIYVTPDNVAGRLVERHGRKATPQGTGLDLSLSDIEALQECRDRARRLYSVTQGRVDRHTLDALFPSLPAYNDFWQIVSKIIDRQGQ